MARVTQCLTSDVGEVRLKEKQIFKQLYIFNRENIRPVSPTCKDIRSECGFRIGSYVFCLRRTLRVYKDTYPPEYMKDAL